MRNPTELDASIMEGQVIENCMSGVKGRYIIPPEENKDDIKSSIWKKGYNAVYG